MKDNIQQKSRLLMKEQPIVVDKELAKLIGLNEAIVLQQIEYWVNIKEVADNKKIQTQEQNFVDGYYWTYNTIDEWNEEFPFWSYDTVKRTLKKLKDKNLVVTGTFNKKGYDRTLWYRVNHPVLIELESKSAKCPNEETSHFSEEKSSEALKTDNSAKCPNGIGQNALMHQGKMPSPIPKTSTKTSTKISTSSSSKGEETSPLVQSFQDSICELRKTTLPKFMKYVEKYDNDFIQAVIEYCENYNAKSFAWFAKAMDGFIEEGATTLESLKETIEKFENEQKKKRNRAIRAKEERAEAEQKAHEIGMSVVNGVEYVEPEVELKEVNLEGCEDISENIKSLIKQNISEVSYNTWIAPYTFMYDGKKVFIDVPNSFTKDILEKRYVDTMIELLATQGIVARIIITVNGMM